jgi:hypothetical protein
MIKNIDELAKFVKGDADVLQKAIDSEEEISVELVDGSFVSDTELDTLKESRFNDGKKEGNTIGYDHAMKDIKKDFEIELEGKDRKKITEAIQTKIITDAKIEPDKKVTELNTSLSNLQLKYETDLGLKAKEIGDLNVKLGGYRINGDLTKHIPEGLNGIDVNDFITVAKTTAKFEYDNDILVVKKGDTILKDKMEKPISPKDYLTELAVSKKWLQSEGRGGGDDTGGSGTYKNINEVYKHMEENKINPLSAEGKKLVDDFNKLKQ